ncbi:U3 snoRNP protein, partial [Serendipita sp. 398]
WQLHIRYSHNGEQAFPPLIHTRSEGSLVYSYVALSPKRAVLAEPQAVWILDLESGQEMQHLTIDYEGEVAVLDVAISPDSRTLVYIGKQSHLDRAIVWNLERREVIATFDMEAASIPYRAVVAFSNDSARVAIGAFYAATKLYNSTSMDEITTLMEDIQFRGEKLVTFCPRNLYLATGSSENPSVIIWGQELGNKVATLEGHTSGVVSISFSSDGERIASISTDQTVRVWNVSSGEPLESIFTGYLGDIRRCALSSDWTKLIAATAGNELHLYDLIAEQSGESAQGKHAEPPGVGVVFTASVTGKILARSFAHFRGDRQMGVRLWETKTGKNLGMLDTGPHSVAGIAISPDDRLIVISMWSRTDLLIWDLDTRTKVQELDSQREGLEGLVFSSNSKVLAAWTFGHILVCDLDSSKFVYKTIEGFENFLALSPDGTRFAGIRNTTLFVRNIASGVELLASGEGFYKGPCTFHPDGNLLVIVFHSQIALIQVQQDSLQLLSKIRRGSPWMWSPTPDEHLSFSPDGQYLACSFECWYITSLSGILYTGNSPPASFTNPGSQRHSFLACHDGWVYSSYPPYPLFPIPSEIKTTGGMSKELSWYAHGETLVLWNESGQPIVIDCAPMLARARQ